MESMNYTYEEENGYCEDVGDWTEWRIINRDGFTIARAHSEESAALIVSALNGVAV